MRGFTLVEMLIALAVFALLAVAGAGLLGATLDGRKAAAAAVERLAELQRARMLLRDDIGQLRARRMRDVDGDRRPWQFLGNARPVAGEPLMAFLRGGWTNPGMAEARSGLVYVEYRLEDGRLVRRLLPRPDPTRETPESRQVLLDGLTDLRLSFLVQGAWRDRWLVSADTDSGALPAAVALEADVAGLGRLRQLFLAPGASS